MKKEKFDLLDENVVEKYGLEKGDRLMWTIKIIDGKETLTNFRKVPHDYVMKKDDHECILSEWSNEKFDEIDWVFIDDGDNPE